MSKTKIINFLVALKHEALPIIDYFELTLNDKKYRNIFSNVEKNTFLIIAGIGIQNAKKAVTKLKQLNKNKDDIWVNIGIAGHEKFKIGSIYEVKKVISSNNENTFYTNSFFNKVPTSTVYCVNQEEKKYNNKYLYDMESYGFLEALDSLTIKENIFMFKIVSDNLQFKPKSYKNFAVSFISKHIRKIDTILDKYRNKLYVWKPAHVDSKLNENRKPSFLRTNPNKITKIVSKKNTGGNYYIPPISIFFTNIAKISGPLVRWLDKKI